MIAPASALADLAALELDEESTSLFLAGTARRLFRIP